MRINRDGLKFIEKWEGMVLYVYMDIAGHKTIGIGHLLNRQEVTTGTIFIAGKFIDYSNGITEDQAYSLLGQDARWAENVVNDLVKVHLTQNQFNALVSFTFNLGTQAFKESTLLKQVNKENFEDIPHQLNRWVYADGVRSQGLVNRRKAEGELFNR